MSKSNLILVLLLGLIGILGVLFMDHMGFFIAGFCFAVIVLATIGQHQANKAASRIDKRIRDHISNSQTSNDGN